MRKLLLVVLIACVGAAVVPSGKAFAADVSVGAYTWVSGWDPFFKKAMNGTVTIDPGLLAGPLVSVKFSDRWSWSNMFLVGHFTGKNKATETYVNSYTGEESSHSYEQKINTWRFDLDSTVNYSINRYFKLIGGFKGMYLDYSFKNEYTNMKAKNLAYGPALGFGVSLPLTDNLFVLYNLSGIYMRSSVHSPDSGGSDSSSSGSVDSSGSSSSNSSYNIIGINTTLSLAYYLGSINTTVSAGVRYQQLRYMATKSGDSMNNADDKFYGVVLSAIYSF